METKGRVRIRYDGDREMVVDAWFPFEGATLCWHRALGRPEWWTITHAPSGMRMFPAYFSSEEDARATLNVLLPHDAMWKAELNDKMREQIMGVLEQTVLPAIIKAGLDKAGIEGDVEIVSEVAHKRMGLGETVRTAAVPCLECGTVVDAAIPIGVEDGEKVEVNADTLALCLSCGHIAAFTEDGTLRELTDEEAAEVEWSPEAVIGRSFVESRKRGPGDG